MTINQLAQPQSHADLESLVEECNQLAFDIYARCVQGSSANLCFSPSSISLALAMTYAGAAGETACEMRDALGYDLPPEQLHQAFRMLQAETHTSGIELRIANRLWAQSGYPFHDEFLEITQACYGARMEAVDFHSATEEVRQQINDWIAAQTAGKITNLIAPRALNSMTRLVLTNAIYFYGRWRQEFVTSDTVQAPFWTSDESSVQIPLMSQTSYFGYGEFDDVQVLEMPYQSLPTDSPPIDSEFLSSDDDRAAEVASDFAMYIFLPRSKNGLQALEQQLSAEQLEQWLNQLTHCNVCVSLPRFRTDAGLQLDEVLKSLGMSQAFSVDQADFSQMSPHPEGMYIGAALHKAFVDVNEQGTEAAAATAVVMVGRSAIPDRPKQFCADHPFLFLIRDRRTGLIHFLGRLTSSS